jgi:hypothetical protein
MLFPTWGIAAVALAAAPPAAGQLEVPLRTVERSDVASRSSSDMPAAIASQVPEGVTFQLEGGLRVDADRVRLQGWLQNASAEAQEITVFPAGPDGFVLQPSTGAATKRPAAGPPMPPPVPPPPLILTLPPRSRLRIETMLFLAEWDWQPGAPRTVDWSFLFWNEPRPHGTLTLPSVPAHR